MRDDVYHLPRLGIGSAMRLYGLTARALRFYEERGLIQARRDRLNCRFYDATARLRLEWISRLRKAGVALPDIEAVLAAETPARRRSVAIAKVQDRCRALERDLVAVTGLLDELVGDAEPTRGVI